MDVGIASETSVLPIDAFGGRTAAVKARNAGSKSGRILTIR